MYCKEINKISELEIPICHFLYLAVLHLTMQLLLQADKMSLQQQQPAVEPLGSLKACTTHRKLMYC